MNALKGTILFAIGAALGSFVTYKVVVTKLEQEVESEIDEMREYYEDKVKEIESETKGQVISKSLYDEANIELKVKAMKDAGYTQEETETAIKAEVTKLNESNDKKESIMDYANKIEDLGYKESDTDGDMEQNLPQTKEEPKVSNQEADIEIIAPEEYGEDSSYEQVDLTYYGNHMLIDDVGNQVKNCEDYIGDALEHFGDFEDDAVHVKNNKYKTYYEIIKTSEVYHTE